MEGPLSVIGKAGGTGSGLGSFITGIATATYNGSNRAVLDGWSLSDLTEWRLTSWETLIESDELVIDDWALEWLPDLGGFCFAEDAPGENRINGVRVKPCHEGPHIYLRAKRLIA